MSTPDEGSTVARLLDDWVQANTRVREAELARFRVEQQIEEMMSLEGAELAESRLVTATLKAETIWDQGKLAGLAEVMPPAEFAQMLTVPPPPPEPRVNIAKAKQLAKLGGAFREIIEAAQTPGLPVLKIKLKEPFVIKG